MICQWCRAPLAFVPGKGWVHANGSLYVSHEEERPCPVCRSARGGVPAPSGPGACLRCKGSGTVRVTVDDHCALPVAP